MRPLVIVMVSADLHLEKKHKGGKKGRTRTSHRLSGNLMAGLRRLMIYINRGKRRKQAFQIDFSPVGKLLILIKLLHLQKVYHKVVSRAGQKHLIKIMKNT